MDTATATVPSKEVEPEVRSQIEDYVDPLADKPELQAALMSILHDFDLIEETTRNYNIRTWKHCENYFHHIQNTYWSEYANDWRTPEAFYKNNPDEPQTDVDLKIINIYRAHAESITAALSVGTPSIRFFPNDADNPADISTSKAKSKIVKMIERQNKAKLLLMRMIYILFNQGMVAVHNYTHESEEYGTTAVPITKKKKANFANLLCPSCAEQLGQLGPDFDGPIKVNQENNQPLKCDTCGSEGVPNIENIEQEIDYPDGSKKQAKCRQKLAAYGPLNVKISSYAYDQKSVGILVLDIEQSLPRAQEMYPNIAGQMVTGPLKNDTAVNARMPNALYDNYTRQQVTVRQAWIRAYQFNSFAKTGNPHEDAIVKQLKEIFPDGVCLHAVGDKYAESHKESLDASWSLSFNPLSRYLHADPIGLSLIPVQDIKNTMVNIQVQSVEYGIPVEFVDPDVLDLVQYRNQRGGPGMVFPTKPGIPGANIGNSFYSSKPATLTDEAGRLESRIDAAGQFVSGDYPSIYGGPNFGDTAAEYSMSRQQALQRLSTTWTILNFLWADVMARSVDGYISNLEEDERYVDAVGDTFVNIWIKKSELEGIAGECYPEGSEQFPTSWAQQREILLQLIQQQNPLVDTVIADPNNRSKVAELLGLPEMAIPGDQDRRKQLDEISKLIQEKPIPPSVDPMSGMPVPPSSTVEIEPGIDDDNEHIQACKHWLNSEVGQYFKSEKPSAYMNVVLHMEAHEQNMQASMMAMQPINGEQNAEGV
jgi:hypothetical protein